MGQQLHNTRHQSVETIIRYRFHPRYGETVVVAGRNRRGDELALIIRQPDGTLAHLPIWMTEDQAEAMTMTENRIPLDKRKHARSRLNGLLGKKRQNSACRRKGVLRGTMDEVSSRGLL